MNFAAVRGAGDPNDEGWCLQKAVSTNLWSCLDIKNELQGSYQMNGFFEYTVPPLEGFWWQEGVRELIIQTKAGFDWISCCVLPDFVTKKTLSGLLQKQKKKEKNGLFFGWVFHIWWRAVCAVYARWALWWWTGNRGTYRSVCGR